MKNVELLFPELCNIYGERSNIDYLKRCCPDQIRVIETSYKSRPAFADGDADMVYLGCMTERKQEMVLEALDPYKDKLQELIQQDVLFLVTGNAIELFGQEIQDRGRNIPCLGFFDYHAVRFEQGKRHNSQFIGSYNGYKVLGTKSQFSFAYGSVDHPFIEIHKGVGMNPETKAEGIHVHHFFATYSLGPLLILNPYFTKEILQNLGLDTTLCYEKEVVDAYEYRLWELNWKLK